MGCLLQRHSPPRSRPPFVRVSIDVPRRRDSFDEVSLNGPDRLGSTDVAFERLAPGIFNFPGLRGMIVASLTLVRVPPSLSFNIVACNTRSRSFDSRIKRPSICSRVNFLVLVTFGSTSSYLVGMYLLRTHTPRGYRIQRRTRVSYTV